MMEMTFYTYIVHFRRIIRRSGVTDVIYFQDFQEEVVWYELVLCDQTHCF